MRSLLRLVLTLVLPLTAAGADSLAKFNLKFVVFGAGSSRNILYLPAPGEEPVALRFLSSERSPEYEYEGPNPLVFFTEVEVPPDPNRPNAPRIQRVPLGYVSIPGGVREAFILFMSEGSWGPNSIPRYTVSIFNDSLNYFPMGHAVFLNATGVPLFGRLGDQDIGVPGGLSQPFAIGEGETSVNLTALANGEQVNAYSDLVPLGRNQRITIVLMPPYREDVQQVQRRFLYDPNRRPVIKRPQIQEGVSATR